MFMQEDIVKKALENSGNESVLGKVKEMTLRQLMVNITNDCQEDADTGFSWELTIEQYLKNLFNI